MIFPRERCHISRTCRPAADAVLSLSRRRCVAADAKSSSGKKGTVYVGKGRFLNDDPAKYPGRSADNMAGGWAGGEKGLWEFRDEIGGKVRLFPELRRSRAASRVASCVRSESVRPALHVRQPAGIQDDAKKGKGKGSSDVSTAVPGRTAAIDRRRFVCLVMQHGLCIVQSVQESVGSMQLRESSLSW